MSIFTLDATAFDFSEPPEHVQLAADSSKFIRIALMEGLYAEDLSEFRDGELSGCAIAKCNQYLMA